MPAQSPLMSAIGRAAAPRSFSNVMQVGQPRAMPTYAAGSNVMTVNRYANQPAAPVRPPIAQPAPTPAPTPAPAPGIPSSLQQFQNMSFADKTAMLNRQGGAMVIGPGGQLSAPTGYYGPARPSLASLAGPRPGLAAPNPGGRLVGRRF